MVALMENNNKNTNRVEALVTYISALLSLIFVAFNLYMFRYTHSTIWAIFAIAWAIDGIANLAKDNTDDINNLLNK